MAEIQGGRFTGRLDGRVNHGREKARRVAMFVETRTIDLSRSYAYSDSVSDLPLLEMVGNPVAANPDARLRAVASDRGWRVMDFAARRRRRAA